MSSAACWSASTARAGEAVRPAVPKLETFLEDTWNQEHARIAKDRQRLRTGSCWAGRDPRASRGPQAFAPKRATIRFNMYTLVLPVCPSCSGIPSPSKRKSTAARGQKPDRACLCLRRPAFECFREIPVRWSAPSCRPCRSRDGHGSRAAQRSCGSAENPAPISGISRPLLRGTTARSSRTVASNLNCAAGKHRARLSRKCTAPCA